LDQSSAQISLGIHDVSKFLQIFFGCPTDDGVTILRPRFHFTNCGGQTRFDLLGGLGAALGQTPAQFALRFCLSYPEVASAIPGMLSPEHVQENAAASELGPLAAGEIARIGAVYRQHSFFVGA